MNVHLPESAQEAVSLLGQGVVIAGGTHAFPRLAPTDSIISLRRAGLSGVEQSGDTVRVGATTTLTELAREVEFLREAVNSIASPRSATWAPSAATCSSPSRTATSRSACSRSTRRSRREGELVTGVSFKVPERWFYRKAMRRKQNSASIVTVASDGTNIALGGVAREPVRATKAEEALAAGDIDAAAELCLEAADPFDDAYASAWYRRRVLPVHVRRAFAHAV